jgi:lipopolysaccharide transport system ATP-binding protein
MANIVISVENLSKLYRLGQIGTGTLSHDLNVWWAKARGKPNPLLKIGQTDHGNLDGEEIWALRDVSFTVEQGEVLGIIGRNGAGKSTLLKILSRVTAPTSGRIKVKGRIASLLEVGTGFHPELTGRENIYLNGAILGMNRKEINRKFDEIVNFAEVEKFIDTPVKRYSSGMYVRLAFAVAAHLEPEILLVDEVLAVGDAEFQKKCLGKMGDVAKEGRTVLFVSHNMQSIEQLCSRGILLNYGRIDYQSNDIREVVDHYISSNSFTTQPSLWNNPGSKYGNRWFKPLRMYISDQDGNSMSMPVRNDADIWLRVEGEITEYSPYLQVGYSLYDERDRLIYSSWTIDSSEENWPIFNKGFCILATKIPKRILNEGTYRIELLLQIRYAATSKITVISREDPVYINYSIQEGLSDSPTWTEKRPGLLAPVLGWTIIKPPKITF